MAMVAAAAGSVAAAAGGDPAATCAERGSEVIVSLDGAGATALATAPDGRLLVDGSPCGAATVAGTKRIEVTGNAAAESLHIDAGGGSFARTAIAVGLGADCASTAVRDRTR